MRQSFQAKQPLQKTVSAEDLDKAQNLASDFFAKASAIFFKIAQKLETEQPLGIDNYGIKYFDRPRPRVLPPFCVQISFVGQNLFYQVDEFNQETGADLENIRQFYAQYEKYLQAKKLENNQDSQSFADFQSLSYKDLLAVSKQGLEELPPPHPQNPQASSRVFDSKCCTIL